MSNLDSLVQTPWARALGWTLFHSLWEGAVIAFALAAALALIRSPRYRYAVACLALIAMLGGFAFTLWHLLPLGAEGASVSAPTLRQTAASDAAGAAQILQPLAGSDLPAWLVPFWIAGVIAFHIRSVMGWISARRLCRSGVCCASDLWTERLEILRTRLCLSRPVILLETSLAAVPVVMGHLRPVILVPVGVLAGLPAGQAEAILLHELAHVLRRDYLSNLLQTIAEGFLFYHPAAWWISSVIRTERENCCDDLVVAASGDAHTYATALVTLEGTRWSQSAALAASNGNLGKRVNRLLGRSNVPRFTFTPLLSAVILVITGTFSLMAWQSKSVVPETPWQKWVNEDVVYIISLPERIAFLNLKTDEERALFVKQFWERRDPTPGTSENEFKEEHYRRIAFANRHFQSNIPGWKTDRGRIYILYGPPDEIESHPAGGLYTLPANEGGGEMETYPFEDWVYHYIKGAGSNIVMEFVDKNRTGDFHLALSHSEKYVNPAL